ncbi:PPE domain-containing protein [Pseudonocardia nigra]|uniref:PPE domain-containing protein n=1 Tax=Pseudonocardia nigra TaxID=1921578 RepID=UPI001C5D5BE6|nr:PPE domain-containing protein [Pseudonocardia nigra]
MSDIRWKGFSHQEIHQLVTAGPGHLASVDAQTLWLDVERRLREIDTNLAAATARLAGSWEGAAADSTRSGLTPLGDWATQAVRHAARTAQALERQAELVATMRNSVPPPPQNSVPEESPGLSPKDGAALDPDWAAADAERDRLAQQAVDAMENYGSGSAQNKPHMYPMGRPLAVTVDVAAAPAGGEGVGSSPGWDAGGRGPAEIGGAGHLPGSVATPGAAGPGASLATPPPPASPASPAAGSAPGAAPPVVPAAPGGFGAAGVGPTGPGPAAAPGRGAPVPTGNGGSGIGTGSGTPVAAVPGGLTASGGGTGRAPGSSAAPGTGRQQGGSAGPAGAPFRPVVPAVPQPGSATPGWRSAPAVVDSRTPPPERGRGGAGGPAVPGSAGGAPRPSPELRPPASGSPAERPATSTAASGEPARSGGTPRTGLGHGYFPPVGMGGAAGGSEREHRRPAYLVDDTDAFADDRWFTEPVITPDDPLPRRSG